ncbi:hypothetical protein AcW1_006972 [Taiwanofungus camphoratus]|nr:hypothetical protein AcV5_002774 [Antrodia cinnamomea]KAI0925021.1 hypothetical protein AcW2_005724 [Antrodia cinnamomea]KAI0929763.1 hypothetical protein AcV7_005220 [Antrodia cinnamomea]KAI0955368.1 hypothetical protein AcW1_006972 [Antrodia cinnamomea]
MALWWASHWQAHERILWFIVKQIYRCSVLWGDYRIIIIPCILYIATFALGIVSLYMTGAPSGDIWAGLAAHVTLAYSSTTIGLNVILTCLICGRILYFARQSQKDLGTQFLRTYISVASIIIESALPFTLSGIAYLVTFGLNNGLEILFLSIYGMFTCISPQLIIMRVVAGRAWNQHTFTVTAASGIFDSPSGLAVSHHPADTNEQAAISLQLQNLTKSDGSSMEIV